MQHPLCRLLDTTNDSPSKCPNIDRYTLNTQPHCLQQYFHLPTRDISDLGHFPLQAYVI